MAARRQTIAAVLVLGGIPAGAAAGLASSRPLGSWIQAAAAVLASVLVLGGAPTRSRSTAQWRLLGLGIGIWALGCISGAGSFDGEAGHLGSPHLADAPRIVGLVVVGAAVLLVAHGRSTRRSWIAHIDALVAGVGVAVVLLTLLWNHLGAPGVSTQERWANGGSLVLLGAVAAAGVRLAITHAS
ncbi:MAG: hypothetical protein ABIY48_09265, partial [Acidimicrobiales bacterium]